MLVPRYDAGVTMNNVINAPPPSRSTLRLASGWPDRPPVFAELPATEELRVPLASHPLSQSIEARQGDVRQGEKLVDRAAANSHLALVPSDAVAESAVQVALLDTAPYPSLYTSL